MDTFGLKIIASDRVFYEGRCKKLIIPAADGQKGIMNNFIGKMQKKRKK